MKIYSCLPNFIIEKGITFKMLTGVNIYSKKELKEIIKGLNGKRYRTVKVLAKNLRGRTDLHGRYYKPSVWLYVEEKN